MPERVVIMTCPPGERPNSGEKDDVSTRNSCNASTETRLLVPPTALSAWDAPRPDLPRERNGVAPKIADTPSTVKLFESALCPATLNCPVNGGPFVLIGAITTPGVSCSSMLKLRPLRGKFSAKLRSITVPTAAFSVLISGAPPVTVTVSEIEPRGRLKLMAITSWTCRMMSGFRSALNPGFDTSMR